MQHVSFRLADPDQFAVWLRAQNLSRRILADELGINRTRLREWERGQRTIHRNTADRLAEAEMPRELLEALS